MGRLWCAFILQVLSLNEVSSVDFKGKENCYVLKRMLSIVAHLANSYSLINDNPESQDLIASLAAPLGSDNKVKDSAMLSTYLTRNTKGARSLRSWWFSLAKEVRTKRVLPRKVLAIRPLTWMAQASGVYSTFSNWLAFAYMIDNKRAYFPRFKLRSLSVSTVINQWCIHHSFPLFDSWMAAASRNEGDSHYARKALGK